MRAVVLAVARAERYRRAESDGALHFVVTSRNGRELARSRGFASSGKREAAIAWLVGGAPRLAAELEPPDARFPVAGYRLDRAPTSGRGLARALPGARRGTSVSLRRQRGERPGARAQPRL